MKTQSDKTRQYKKEIAENPLKSGHNFKFKEMKYSALNSKTKDEILAIIAKPMDYQKDFLKEAFFIGMQKGFINNEKLPFPLDENELGTVSRVFYKVPFFKGWITTNIIFSLFVVLTIVISVMDKNSEQHEQNMGFIFFLLIIGFYAFLLFVNYVGYIGLVNEITVYEKGLKIKKGKKLTLLFFYELSKVEPRIKGNKIKAILIATKWNENFDIIVSDLNTLAQMIHSTNRKNVI